MTHRFDETIAAPATAAGGAIAVVRVSGPEAIAITDRVFRAAGAKRLSSLEGNTTIYGNFTDCAGETVDDVVVSVFRAPHSYTGEDSIEISCHGSRYIVAEIMKTLVEAGARAADAGEFTERAFLAGKMDLSQAEAVADMIAARDRATHAMAATQMRGGYSADLALLRGKLLRLVSLLELELDFSEEDVTFADRTELTELIGTINARLQQLVNSFSRGNAIKEGIPVAIIGSPNAGKSTLLNALLKDDRAMVSDIAGTTRDVIEERITLAGVEFRFIDTAGIRQSDDTLEQMGIERTYKAVGNARIILYIFDASDDLTAAEIVKAISTITLSDDQQLCIVFNKSDKADKRGLIGEINTLLPDYPVIQVSAKYGDNMERIEEYLGAAVDTSDILKGETVVSNLRHYEALAQTQKALESSLKGIAGNSPSDLISQDIREALHWLGAITGEITTDEILGEIFSKFCIGK